jgi:rhodanese-related sulfurtransferase
MGILSKRATKLLLDKGYSNTVNIEGGINKYANMYDKGIPNL